MQSVVLHTRNLRKEMFSVSGEGSNFPFGQLNLSQSNTELKCLSFKDGLLKVEEIWSRNNNFIKLVKVCQSQFELNRVEMFD